MDKLSNDMDGTATRLDLVQVQCCSCIILGCYLYYFWHTLSRLPVCITLAIYSVLLVAEQIVNKRSEFEESCYSMRALAV